MKVTLKKQTLLLLASPEETYGFHRQNDMQLQLRYTSLPSLIDLIMESTYLISLILLKICLFKLVLCGGDGSYPGWAEARRRLPNCWRPFNHAATCLGVCYSLAAVLMPNAEITFLRHTRAYFLQIEAEKFRLRPASRISLRYELPPI